MLTLWSWTYWQERDRGWQGAQSLLGRCRGGRRRRPRTWWRTWRREGRWRGWRDPGSEKAASQSRTPSSCLQECSAVFSQWKTIGFSLEEPRKTVLGWGRFRISTLNGNVLWFSFLKRKQLNFKKSLKQLDQRCNLLKCFFWIPVLQRNIKSLILFDDKQVFTTDFCQNLLPVKLKTSDSF